MTHKMTHTMTHEMTHEDEESMLIDKVLGARRGVADAKAQVAMARLKQSELETYLDTCEQALIDYMQAYGLKQIEAGNCSVTLGESFRVDIADPKAVPDGYLRTKTVVEPDKALIAAMHKAGKLPESNWFAYIPSSKLTIKTKG